METVKEIMDKYGLSYHEAHQLTHVPHRTLQNWYLGYRQEPPYMAYLLESAIIRGSEERHIACLLEDTIIKESEEVY